MEWMPWRRHREAWVKWPMLWLFVAPIKFSTNTSMSIKNGVDSGVWVECCCICSSIKRSNGCGGRAFPISISFAMTS